MVGGIMKVFNNLGVLDFEVALIIIMMFVDVVTGTIDHDYFRKDANSSGAIKGLFGKLALAVFLISILLVVHLNDWNEFKDVQNIISMIRNGADGVVVLLMYFELVSILAHISNITGLDFSNIPMVKQEMQTKALNAHTFHQEVSKMNEEKEKQNNDSTNK